MFDIWGIVTKTHKMLTRIQERGMAVMKNTFLHFEFFIRTWSKSHFSYIYHQFYVLGLHIRPKIKSVDWIKCITVQCCLLLFHVKLWLYIIPCNIIYCKGHNSDTNTDKMMWTWVIERTDAILSCESIIWFLWPFFQIPLRDPTTTLLRDGFTTFQHCGCVL